jgi:hypothetical protein
MMEVHEQKGPDHLLRNGFIEALESGLEHSIGLEDVPEE